MTILQFYGYISKFAIKPLNCDIVLNNFILFEEKYGPGMGKIAEWRQEIDKI
jgi:hypothetical protein